MNGHRNNKKLNNNVYLIYYLHIKLHIFLMLKHAIINLDSELTKLK